jgi:hypothetical protein
MCECEGRKACCSAALREDVLSFDLLAMAQSQRALSLAPHHVRDSSSATSCTRATASLAPRARLAPARASALAVRRR